MQLRIASPWRLISDGRIALGWEDHGQLFGRSAPLDAPQIAASLIRETTVVEAEIDDSSGDLSILFENGRILQVFNGSCGYEGWQVFGPGSRAVIAQGGGNVETLG